MKREPVWLDEPNELRWTDKATGLRCLLRRVPDMGHLCGYVRLPPGHPWRPRRRYVEERINVHGGITFFGTAHTLTHPLRGTWLGFDCAHAWDYAPGLDRQLHALRDQHPELPPVSGTLFGDDTVYRSVAFVVAQCADLAQQIARARR